MAGIGFNLQKIMEGDTYFDSLKAHFYSSLICAGPWLLSILTLFCLGYLKPHNIDHYEITVFRSVIIYIFAFSLIFIGIFHFPVTRYLADKLYAKEAEALVPAYTTLAVYVTLFQGVAGFLFFRTTGLSTQLQVLAVFIYLTISLLWVLMIFLTALRDYEAIVGAYFLGSVVAVVASVFLGKAWGLSGYFAGYLLGHFLIVMLWSARIFIEFGSPRIFDWDFLSFLMRQKKLIFIGLFYNLALWIDKIVFWMSGHATSVMKSLRIFTAYDSAVFFAYLTIIPGLAIFLITIETGFYQRYRNYYTAIMDRATYPEIKRLRSLMVRELRDGAALLLRYQGILSLLMITFAPEISKFLHLPTMHIPIFRIAVVGAFLHGLLLMVLIVILYFDFQRLALLITAVFFVTNTVFTYITAQMEMVFFGYGYLFSGLISLAIAFYALDQKLKRLEYFTFALQPVGKHREEEIA